MLIVRPCYSPLRRYAHRKAVSFSSVHKACPIPAFSLCLLFCTETWEPAHKTALGMCRLLLGFISIPWWPQQAVWPLLSYRMDPPKGQGNWNVGVSFPCYNVRARESICTENRTFPVSEALWVKGSESSELSGDCLYWVWPSVCLDLFHTSSWKKSVPSLSALLLHTHQHTHKETTGD